MALPRNLQMVLDIGGRLSEAAVHHARREFERTELGRAVRHASHRSHNAQREIDRAVKRLHSHGVGDVMRYAARGVGRATLGRVQNAALEELYRALGPAGKILKKVLGGGGAKKTFDRDVHAAAALLRSLGYDVRPAIRPHNTPLLEGTGLEPGEAKPYRPDRRHRDIPLEPEQQRIDPPERGPQTEKVARRVQMVRVRGSSNVFAIGFDEDKWDMYVTYLGGTGDKRSGEGPSYVYHGVPPLIFNTAVAHLHGGMGSWVWDNLRMRGTVYGHQFTYEIVKVGPGGYVPRQATAIGYRPRLVRQAGKLYGSTRRGTGWFQGTRAGQVIRGGSGVNRGTPNTGAPRRGTPNRGR